PPARGAPSDAAPIGGQICPTSDTRVAQAPPACAELPVLGSWVSFSLERPVSIAGVDGEALSRSTASSAGGREQTESVVEVYIVLVMGRVVLCVATLLALSGSVAAAPNGPAGTYTGMYECGHGPIALSLSITPVPDGSLTALF